MITEKDLRGTTVYCHAGLGQFLDKFGAKYIGYNAGSLGWNWDAYELGNFVLIWGYRDFPQTSIEIYYDKSKELAKRLRTAEPGERAELLLAELRKLA